MRENTDQKNSDYGPFSSKGTLFTWADFYVKTSRGSQATKISPIIMKVDLKNFPWKIYLPTLLLTHFKPMFYFITDC